MNKTSETSITCPNNDCGKTFEKPLSTINLKQDPNRKYQACPYCLTEIPTFEREYQQEEEISEEITTIPENDDFEVEEEDKKVKDFSRIEENQSDCKYHLGYLGEEKHQQIPDDCLICAKIMECMRQR